MTAEKITLNTMTRKVTDLQVKLNTLRADLNNLDLATLNTIDVFVSNILDSNAINVPSPVFPITAPVDTQRPDEPITFDQQVDEFETLMTSIEIEVLHQIHIQSGSTESWAEKLEKINQDSDLRETLLRSPMGNLALDQSDIDEAINSLEETIANGLPAVNHNHPLRDFSITDMLEDVQEEIGEMHNARDLIKSLRTGLSNALFNMAV